MRAERLAWAEKPAVKVDVERRQPPAAGPARHSRQRILHRGGVRVLARMLDALAVFLVTLGLCVAAGIKLWSVPVASALPYLAMPAAGVAAVWIAGGYRFRYAEAITTHLTRVALGATAAMSALFLTALVARSPELPLFAQLSTANAVALFALHANYLAIVRAATRKGYLSDNVVIVGATQA